MLRTGIYLQGRYEILGLIGSGGMADVYKAKCHKLNRLVAIKVLKEEFSDDSGFLGKFQMEAQAAAGLSHPNIVNVYDVVDEGNIHCIVMELIEGITLKSYILKKGKLEVKEAVGIAIQVAQGIAAAHEQKIIHRDIKPQNMIISRDGKVKVADFGIARAATTQTMTSEAMGSVHYISPEQARGGYSDARSDIYSLGITMYEMVTGRLPFEGENTVAIAIAQLQEPITRPSFYNPEIPVSLEGIILKCTEKKPERRYSQILEVIADLRRMLVHPDDDFVQPVPEVDMGAGTVVIGKEELEEIKRGIDSAREWDSLGSRDSMAVRDGIRDWEISGSRDNMISRDNSRDWDNTNGRDSMTYRDNSQDWEISDDGDDVLTRDSRDWDNTGGRDYVRGRDNTGERNNRREWAWEEEEWERNQDRDHHNSRDNDVAPKFEKLLTSLGVLMAILIVAILVVVFSRIGGLLNFSSDDESSDIQTEIISSEESTSSMEVEVPNVLELPVDMAEDRLKESTLVMKVSGYANSDTVDKDCLISQEFPEGTVIQKYSTVTVVVSNGSDLVKLSELTLEGMTEETAKVLLEQKKLIVKEEQEYHDTIKEGQVIRYEPSQARPGETVTLYISAGPITVMKTVPDIRQKTEEEAISNLLQAGLNPGQVSQEYHDTIPQGYVISQGVEPNLLIKEGSTVSYIVSKGTEPKRYITTINENYNLGRAVGPGMLAADVTVEVRLKQTVNGETIYTTLMSPTTFAGTDIISLSFHDVEGAPGVETGEVEVFDVDSGQILASFPVKFTAVVEG